jgi:hypothetical protein
MGIFTKTKLKDFNHFHKYNVGDEVIVQMPGEEIKRVATIKSVGIYFSNGYPAKFSRFHPAWKQLLFGKIKESDRYYFIDDWEDEYCDLTLDDIIDYFNLESEDIKITKNPEDVGGEIIDDKYCEKNI